jgi:DNA helicase IV
MYFILSFVAIILLFLAIFYKQLNKNRKYTNDSYLNNLQQIIAFIDEVNLLNDYTTWVHRDNIKKRFEVPARFFRNKTQYYDQEPRVKQFNEIYSEFDNYIIKYNHAYVKAQKEMLITYFDDIEGKKLDEQQRTAVITDEYSNLIIAGAGSGKTLTILAKVKYLLEKKNVAPEDILLLSFTKKTVEELNERLKTIGLATQATTFHKLGYDTIKKYVKAAPALANENLLSNIVREFLEKEIFDNSEALEAFVVYVACYMNIAHGYDSYDSLGEKLDTEKGVDLQTLKSKSEPELNKIDKVKLDTIQGEKVKSVEELIIANFLYLQGVQYEYEKP